MTPAGNLALATAMAHRHARGCQLGRELERCWLGRWRAAVLALSSRRWG